MAYLFYGSGHRLCFLQEDLYSTWCACVYEYVLFSISLCFNRDQFNRATNNVHLGCQLEFALMEFAVLHLLAWI